MSLIDQLNKLFSKKEAAESSAAQLSLARGLHPDRPPHLHKVTETR